MAKLLEKNEMKTRMETRSPFDFLDSYESLKKLCAVFIDRESKLPIRGMVVYAEAKIKRLQVQKEELNVRKYYEQKVQENLEKGFPKMLVQSLTKAFSDHLLNRMESNNEGLVDQFATHYVNYINENKDQIISNPTNSDTQLSINQALKRFNDFSGIRSVDDSIQIIPFGHLGTNQAGYVSFDIENSMQNLDLGRIQKMMMSSSNEHESVPDLMVELWMYPNGDLANGYNVSGFKRQSESYVFGNIEITAPESQLKGVAYPSLQRPDLIDWYLSPGSFSVNPNYMIGDDGCEQLFPSNFATSEFRFYQIVKGQSIQGKNQEANFWEICTGDAFEYQTVWQPLGHTLGQIIYSLPLAPGEIIKIGIIDWKRSSEDSRTEDTDESEDLTHNTYRDRSILETVKGALHEWQRGGNVVGGNSGGAGVSYGIPVFGATAGNAHSFGGGYSTSSGDRDLTVNTVQQVNDAFSQHSTAIRALRSTVVVQSDQQEYARAETRVIANNNHSHALTMLYYEVLRHYKVITQYMRRRDVLLIKYAPLRFDFYYEIYRHRQTLFTFLLDRSLEANFGVMDRFMNLYLMETQKPNVPNPQDFKFDKMDVFFETGTNGGDGDVRVDFLLNNNQVLNVRYPMSQDDLDKTKLDTPSNNFEANSSESFYGCVFPNNVELRIGDIKQIIISYRDSSRKGSLSFAGLRIMGFSKSNQAMEIVNFHQGINLNCSIPNKPAQHGSDYGDRQPYRHHFILPDAPPARDDNWAAYSQLSVEDKQLGEKLKLHINENIGFYSRLIWMHEDGNDRALRFETVNFGGKNLIDWIENRPIDVLGNYVVFPTHYVGNKSSGSYYNMDNKKAKSEKLMTLPSRGVFGEAKLGHCNASEVIDNTRFWDWQQSPIMEKASEIEAISLASRNVSQPLAPTQFSAPIVNVVSPTPAPDPTGMASAMELLGKSDIFRNMSMSAEVTDLLKKLSDNSVSFAEAANKAREIMKKEEGQGSNGQGSSGSNSSTSGNNATESSGSGNSGNSNKTTSPEEQERQNLNNSDRKLEIAKQHLTPKQQQAVREKVKEDLVTDSKPIYISLQSNDGGTVINVPVPADYDINQQYQGKLPFVGGTATAMTKTKSGTFHIKLEGKIANFEGREFIQKLPGYGNPEGVYYFETSCLFKFENAGSVALKGMITLSEPVNVEVFADVEGKITAEYNSEVAFPVKIFKVAVGSKVSAEVAGKAGFKITYKVYSITGMSLVQQ